MRSSGVLMHISSLPGDTGIGTMGENAYKFVDFLKKSGQKYWQLLPIHPTEYGDSPYQSSSVFAGNPYFIDLKMLEIEGYLKREEYVNIKWCDEENSVNYSILYNNRHEVFSKIYKRFILNVPKDFNDFCKENSLWLDNYALYMAVKNHYNNSEFTKWDEDIKKRTLSALQKWQNKCKDKILYYKMIQYFFFKQYFSLKKYANDNGIKIIGDIPIYVAADSADVWANASEFDIDENFTPNMIAGCPPDNFSADGQLWGNPVFNWKNMKKNNYSWWKNRVRFMMKLYDVMRIDHFRGFESYYCIPYGSANAVNGKWKKGPGIDLFNAISKELGKLNIIAEDLGFLTPEVRKLVRDTGFPGMKILQFGFDSREDSDYLPHNYDSNCVVYTGTHDNDTIMGWFKTAPKNDCKFAIEYLRLTKEEGYHWGMMKSALASKGDMVILTMQDLLGLGSEARMNIPSTLGTNWKWRADKKDFKDELAEKLYKYTAIYKRI